MTVAMPLACLRDGLVSLLSLRPRSQATVSCATVVVMLLSL